MYRKSQVILAILLVLLLVAIGSIFWLVRKHLDSANRIVPTSTEQTSEAQDTVEPVTQEIKPEFDSASLQKSVDDWAATISGQASVVLADKDANILASHNPEQAYFTASIYKLYTAYFGYQAVDAKEVDPTEAYVNGHTRAECLDLMIRESDSPCAEKLWNELGKQSQTEKLVAIGIKNTSMEGLSTTAEDAAVMLAFIVRGEALTQESRAAFLQSMKTQIFRDSLNVGFSGDVTVYNKIGFNGRKEYHDTAIVEFADGRKLIVSVLTENVGTKAIANLGSLIEKAVKSE